MIVLTTSVCIVTSCYALIKMTHYDVTMDIPSNVTTHFDIIMGHGTKSSVQYMIMGSHLCHL